MKKILKGWMEITDDGKQLHILSEDAGHRDFTLHDDLDDIFNECRDMPLIIAVPVKITFEYAPKKISGYIRGPENSLVTVPLEQAVREIEKENDVEEPVEADKVLKIKIGDEVVTATPANPSKIRHMTCGCGADLSWLHGMGDTVMMSCHACGKKHAIDDVEAGE